ncbi:MAG: hypothetical protein IT369_11830 [Candidatus Latescibacteria bacterium]|nr:hypothetical protein [Candidatus Latescibacterota bacterium]
MTWVYVAFSFGVIAFFVEMLLSYHREADRFKKEQQKARQAINAHSQAEIALQQQTRDTKTKIEELTKEKAQLEHDVNWNKTTLEELEEKEKRRSLSKHRLEAGEDA